MVAGMVAMPVSQRIKLARKHARMTQNGLAEACGWDGQSRVSNYETGERVPGVEELDLIAKATGVSAYWLMTGEGDMLGGPLEANASDRGPIRTWRNGDSVAGMVVIPRYDVWASMGDGNHIDHEPELADGDLYRESFALAAGWTPRTHFAMRVKGDSMIEAGLRDGWSIVVDSRDTKPEPGEIYAIKYGIVGLMVKYVEPTPSGGLRIISANRSIPQFRDPIELTSAMAEDVVVLGRVVHVQGLIGKRGH